jgi:hypothetical protein
MLVYLWQRQQANSLNKYKVAIGGAMPARFEEVSPPVNERFITLILLQFINIMSELKTKKQNVIDIGKHIYINYNEEGVSGIMADALAPGTPAFGILMLSIAVWITKTAGLQIKASQLLKEYGQFEPTPIEHQHSD